jgi:hypothetical protein
VIAISDFIFNIAKGAFVEKFRDGAANGFVLLLKAADTDAAMKDTTTITGLLATAADEATDASYARKTGLTGTITVDQTNDRVDVDLNDQTFTALAGAALTDLVVGYEEAAADTTRIPLACLDFVATPDGSDLVAVFNAAGFARAS